MIRKNNVYCLLVMSFNLVFHIILFDISQDGKTFLKQYSYFHLSYTRYLGWFYEMIYVVIGSNQILVCFVVEEDS